MENEYLVGQERVSHISRYKMSHGTYVAGMRLPAQIRVNSVQRAKMKLRVFVLTTLS